MIYPHLFVVFFILVVVECGSYQHVQFFHTGKPIEIRRPNSGRSSRHLPLLDYSEFPELPLDFWTPDLFPVSHTLSSPGFDKFEGPSYFVDHNIETGYVHDPFLLTGEPAKRAARYLYSRELFFTDIPHYRAIMHNQEMRRRNGLAPNVLGSLRPSSAFYRKHH